MHILRVVSGPGSGQEFEVRSDLVIGREDADITLADEEVSRRHAVVRPAGTGIEIEDLESMNGTVVDGKRITTPVRLTLNARIEIGPSVIEARMVQQSPTRVSQSPSAEPVAAPAATRVSQTQPPPAGPSPAAAAPEPPDGPGAQPPRSGDGSSRKAAPVVLGALLVGAAIVAAVLLASGGDSSEEATKRTLTGRATSAVITPPALKLTAAGQLRAKPTGRMAVLIDRTVPRVPQPGGPPVPLDLRLTFSQPAGGFRAHLTGTVRVSRNGTEIVRGRAPATGGTGDYEGIKGSLRLKGDNGPESTASVFQINGTLEY